MERKIYITRDNYTKEEALAEIVKMEKHIPIGSFIKTEWYSNCRCLILVQKYVFDEERKTIAVVGNGVNNVNEVDFNHTFGLYDNYISLASDDEIEFMAEKGISKPSKPVSPISAAELEYVANCEKYISQFDEDKLNSSELNLCALYIAKCIDLDIRKSILECLLVDEGLKESKSRWSILKQNMKTLCYQVLKHNMDLSRDAQCYLLSTFMEYVKEKYIIPIKK